MDMKNRILLRRARIILEEGDAKYIGHALERAWLVTGISPAYLRDYVARALAPHASLVRWQTIERGMAGRTVEQQRRDLLAWIDWMLGDLE